MCPTSAENKLKDFQNCAMAALTMESLSFILRLWPIINNDYYVFIYLFIIDL